MSALAQHVMLRLRDDRVIAPSVAARRLLARVVLSVSRDKGLLCFRAADTHMHAVVMGTKEDALELARRVEIALTLRLGHSVGFAPAHVRSIESQHHLQRAFWYVLRQEEHHGLDSDVHHEASNLPDLLGLRPMGAYTADIVRSHLPRVHRAELVERLGLADPIPADLSLVPLAGAAAAALAIADLRGRTREAVLARRAALRVARDLRRPGEAAATLGLSERTARHMARCRDETPTSVVRAVHLQLALRQPRVRGP